MVHPRPLRCPTQAAAAAAAALAGQRACEEAIWPLEAGRPWSAISRHSLRRSAALRETGSECMSVKQQPAAKGVQQPAAKGVL